MNKMTISCEERKRICYQPVKKMDTLLYKPLLDKIEGYDKGLDERFQRFNHTLRRQR
jgi:hypothetical protein